MKTIASLIVAFAAFAATQSLADEPQSGVRVVVPAHDIARGEVIADADLSYQMVPASHSLEGVVTSPDDLTGREARRLLRSGEVVRADDVKKPVLITKGSTVTMSFEAPGITLTAVGKAVTEGGLGESIVVLNPVSYRQVTATVTGQGQAKANDASAIITADKKL